MSQPVSTSRPEATPPPRPPDPAWVVLRNEIRRTLADTTLTDTQRATRIARAADEYAAKMIETYARPARGDAA